MINKLTFFIAISLGVFFISCSKKNASDEDISLTLSMLQRKWVFVKYVTNAHFSDMDHFNTTTGSSGDYMNFSTNQKLYVRLLSFEDTLKYNVLRNNRILLNGIDTFDVTTLNETELVLYQKSIYSATSYKEETYNFTK